MDVNISIESDPKYASHIKILTFMIWNKLEQMGVFIKEMNYIYLSFEVYLSPLLITVISKISLYDKETII